MIELHHGNRIEGLADALAAWLGAPRADAFSTDLVVVNSKGLERWLAMQLAERWGVCADVRFELPGPALDEALADVLGDAPSDRWSEGPLAFAIARVLPGLLDDPGWPCTFHGIRHLQGPRREGPWR